MTSASECNWLDAYPEEPCWGAVKQQAEAPDGSEVHACQGHTETADWCHGSAGAQKYIPEPLPHPPSTNPMDPFLPDASDPRLVTMAVKLAQLYVTAMPYGSRKKMPGDYYWACYEFFPLMELEIVPKMIFESVTRNEFFAACEEQGFLTLAQTFEAEFSQQLHALPYSTTRWFQHSTPS